MRCEILTCACACVCRVGVWVCVCASSEQTDITLAAGGPGAALARGERSGSVSLLSFVICAVSLFFNSWIILILYIISLLS